MKKMLCFLLLLSPLPARRQAESDVWIPYEALNQLGSESDLPFRCEIYEDTDVCHVIACYDGFDLEEMCPWYMEKLTGSIGVEMYKLFRNAIEQAGFSLDLHLSVRDGDECLVFAMADEKPVDIPYPLEEIHQLQSVLQAFAIAAGSGLNCTMTYDPPDDRIVVLFGSDITSSELNNPALQGSEVYTEAMDSIAELGALAHDSIRDALDSLEYDMDVVVLFYTSDHVLYRHTVNGEFAAI